MEKSLDIFKNKNLFGLALFFLIGLAVGIYFDGDNNHYQFTKDKPIAYSEEAITAALGANPSSDIDFDIYFEVWDKIKSNYVDTNQLSDKELFYGSLRGLAEATDDPYTVFMDPEETKEFADDLAGVFEGIGAEIGLRKDIPTVIAPLEGMPAQKAGLRSGDKIYAVNDEPTIGLSLNEIIKKIRGPKDTEVKLTIIRNDEKPMDIKIVRSLIVTKSVKTEMRSDGIYVIKISNFNDDTLQLFNEAVDNILVKKPRGIILDLRNNPGGYLDTAVALASEWVKEGPVVAEQFNNNRRNEYPASGRARLSNIPTVVLVNGGSASASEILAGALRDYKLAKIVGETTYGKGSVQSLNDLSSGGTLKITVAKWLTPAGDDINDKGLEPDVKVEMTMEDLDAKKDPQLDKALEILKAKKQ